MKTFRIVSVVSTMAILANLVFPWAVAPVQGEDYYGEDPNKKILKNALLGAGTGAIAASASGGKAGKGALIGAGVNVIGSALLDSLTGQPKPQPQPVYVQQQPQPQYQYAPQPVEYQYQQAPPQTQYPQIPQYQPQTQSQPQTQYSEPVSSKKTYRYDDDWDEDTAPKKKYPAMMGGCAKNKAE